MTGTSLILLKWQKAKKKYTESEMPTNLSEIWNHNTGYHAFFTHRYNLGFYRGRDAEK